MDQTRETRLQMTYVQTALKATFFAGVVACMTGLAWSDGHFVLNRDLDTRMESTCTGESALGSFIADAIRKANSADIGLVNCGAIRGNKLYAAGSSFTPVAVAFELPQGRKTVVLELSGMQILDIMEHSVSALPSAAGAFLQVSGLRMEVDVNQPPGTRVVKLTVDGAALDLGKTYKVATTDELSGGAEGFAALKMLNQTPVGTNLVETEVSSYLQDKGVKDIRSLGRIKMLR